MVPDSSRTSLGLEYFVDEGDDLWAADDQSLIELAKQECSELGLIDDEQVEGGLVIRTPKAYPIYDKTYKKNLSVIRNYLESIPNLQLVGRNGQHRYNNQDHSMLTGIYAARNVCGAEIDIWNVNLEAEYHEHARDLKPARTGERLVPEPLGIDE